ncbi:ABC transporter substrate-binding protein [Aureimonas sp. AU22]|uniref:ABC transporter substrate-binding protein n=1 Tax=Aureimonas sp. AU22 TaxID=1638162 RepID=UPI000783A5B4|nr:ABC transporter substrate-binding protein [Aureimonas sp. AU22]
MRSLLAVLGLALLASAAPLGAASAQTPVRMVLNWKYQGPQALFFLAEDKGYFKQAGLDVTIDQGEGSAAAITKVATGAYDVGFGDINALIALAATQPDQAPIGIYQMFNTPPFTIAVKADGPIAKPADLAGKTIGGPASDGALKLFPAFAKAAGIDPAGVTVTNMQPNLREQMLMSGQVDGVFGYVNTIAFSAKAAGIDPETQLRFVKFGDYGLDLYSNAVVASKSFAAKHPEALKGLVAALNRATKDMIADPAGSVDAVMSREPLLNQAVEVERTQATLAAEMNHPEIKTIGLGAIDPARMRRAIDVVVEANALPRTPALEKVFTDAFLPPLAERPTAVVN